MNRDTSAAMRPAPERISPEAAGYRPEALERLEEHWRSVCASHGMQGYAYLLARDGRIFARNAYGQLLYNNADRALATNSIRRIASVTKLFTAVAVFQLIERGKLYLGQSVSAWIPEFKHPLYEGIQIHHLLTHTSGLMADGGYHLEPYPMGPWTYEFAFKPEAGQLAQDGDDKPQGEASGNAWIKALLAGSPRCKPGEKWAYSSSGYSVLGEIISRASGEHYEDYVIKHILQPLGMHRTFFEVPEELHEEVCISSEMELQRLKSAKDRRDMPPRAGGGLYSTLDDLFRFGQMLLNEGELDGVRILSRKSLERMTRDALADRDVPAFNWGEQAPFFRYGMGCVIRRLESEMISPGAFGHEGAGRCKLFVDPRERLVVVIFTPMGERWIPEAIIQADNIIWAGLT